MPKQNTPKYDNLEIVRAGQVVTVPRDIYEEIYRKGMFIVVHTIKRSYGNYFEVKVNKKEGNKRTLCISLARYILGTPKFKHSDHIDRNPLNNCRSNLRAVTRRENGCNRRKTAGTRFPYKGVNVAFKSGEYRVAIAKDKIKYSAGPFKTVKEAARVYDQLAVFLHGEHAALNFPNEVTQCKL